MKKVIPLLMGGFLMLSVAACNNAKTTSDAPNSTDNNGQVPPAQNAQNTKNAQDDASNGVRKKQVESDIRAREQRNDAGGNQEKRADGDLQSEVRDKLEANIPNSKLTVDSKNGAVTVAGTVPNQQDLSKVAPLAKQIKGVQSVAVKATVVPSKTK